MNGVVMPPTLDGHPDFAEFRPNKARNFAKLYKLCSAMQQSGDSWRRTRRVSLWADNLTNGSVKRLWELLAQMSDAGIIETETGAEDGLLTISWQEWVWDTRREYAPAPASRPAYPSDDPEVRRQKREQRNQQARNQAEGGASAPPSANLSNAAESLRTPQTTPQAGGQMGNSEMADSAVSLNLNLNSNSKESLKEFFNSNLNSIESNSVAESTPTPQAPDDTFLLRSVLNTFAECGLERSESDGLISEHGLTRARDVVAIIRHKPKYHEKRMTRGYVYAAFKAGPVKYPLPKMEDIPAELQQSLGLLVTITPKSDSAKTPQATPQRSSTWEPGLGASGSALRREAAEKAEIGAKLERFREGKTREERQAVRDAAAARLKESAPQVYDLMQREISAGKAEFGAVVRGNLDTLERDIWMGLMAQEEAQRANPRTGTDG